MRCWQAGIVAGIVVGRLFHDRAASTWLSSGAENTLNRHGTDPSGSITRQVIWPGAVRISTLINYTFACPYICNTFKETVDYSAPSPNKGYGKNGPTLWTTIGREGKPPLRLMDLSCYDLDFDRTRMHPGWVTDLSGHTPPSLTHLVDVKSSRST